MILFLFREEVATASSTSQRWKCTHRGCKKSYISRKNLNQHVKRVHLGKKYKCSLCSKILETKDSVKRHVNTIHRKQNAAKHVVSCDIVPLKQFDLAKQDNIISKNATKINKIETEINLVNAEIVSLRRQLKSN